MKSAIKADFVENSGIMMINVVYVFYVFLFRAVDKEMHSWIQHFWITSENIMWVILEPFALVRSGTYDLHEAFNPDFLKKNDIMYA